MSSPLDSPSPHPPVPDADQLTFYDYASLIAAIGYILGIFLLIIAASTNHHAGDFAVISLCVLNTTLAFSLKRHHPSSPPTLFWWYWLPSAFTTGATIAAVLLMYAESSRIDANGALATLLILIPLAMFSLPMCQSRNPSARVLTSLLIPSLGLLLASLALYLWALTFTKPFDPNRLACVCAYLCLAIGITSTVPLLICLLALRISPTRPQPCLGPESPEVQPG